MTPIDSQDFIANGRQYTTEINEDTDGSLYVTIWDVSEDEATLVYQDPAPSMIVAETHMHNVLTTPTAYVPK